MKLLLLRLVLCKFKQKEQVYNVSINLKLLKNSQDETLFYFISKVQNFNRFERCDE